MTQSAQPNQPTEADHEVARKRYEEYIRITKENSLLSFDEVLDMLSDEGATILRCGHTRFEHVNRGRWC